MGASLSPIDEPSFNEAAATQFTNALDENIGSVLRTDPNTINHQAMGYQLGAQATGNLSEQPVANNPPLNGITTERPVGSEPDPAVEQNDHVPRETAPLATQKTKPKSDHSENPSTELPEPLSPETAKERFKALQQKNRKLAKQVVHRLKISSDVMEIDEGMGYLMTELRTPLLFENRQYPDVCTDHLALHCFTRLTSMSLALYEIEILCQNGPPLNRQFLPSHTLANAFGEGLSSRDLYQSSEGATLRQRALSALGTPTNDLYTGVTEELLEPLEIHFFAIIECWRLMKWQLDLADTNN